MYLQENLGEDPGFKEFKVEYHNESLGLMEEIVKKAEGVFL